MTLNRREATGDELMWGRLIDVVLSDVPGPPWVRLALADQPEQGDVPSLDGATLMVDGARVLRLISSIRAVIEAERAVAAMRRRWSVDRHGALELVAAGLTGDTGLLDELASIMGIDPPTLRSVAHLASIPLLNSCEEQLRARVSASWTCGWCPICGAWPALAEVRGLERARRLRCGRCGADWPFAHLRCNYCGESSHDRLGTLVPDEGRSVRRVDNCATCRGFLKSVPTHTALALRAVLELDAETMALDAAALEAGFSRPATPGHSLHVRLTEGA